MGEMHRCADCGAPDANPQFTKPLREVKGKDDKQPLYFCRKHARKHPSVSPTGGRY